MRKPYLRKQMAVNKLYRSLFHFTPTVFLIAVLSFHVSAQHDTSSVNHERLRVVVAGTTVGYAAGLLALNHIWYKDTERQSFRFFNDQAEWKQLDKLGHVYTSFYLSYSASKVLQWCNIEDRKANIYGALTGFAMTVPIELLDGFSDGYGASVGDIVADAAGPVFFLIQGLHWNEVRIYPKLSFHRTDFAPLRPALLGDGLLSEIVKDYNGQTQWLSIDMDKFIAFPKWLNLAIGYGAENMIFARDAENIAAGYDPYRQYYFSIDFDLTAIRTKSRFIKTLIHVANAIKLPAPAIQLSRKGSEFYLLYW